jgi:hypothetical protein
MPSLSQLADILEALARGDDGVRRTVALLRQGAPDTTMALLDAHMDLLKRHCDAVQLACERLPAAAADLLGRLASAPAPAALATGDDSTTDGIALELLHQLAPWVGEARLLAVALGRFVEDSLVLQPQSRRKLPLGRGFEELFDARLLHRYALLPDRADLLPLLHRRRLLLFEEPDEAIQALEQELGRSCTASERAWLELERRAGTLRFVRHDKTEGGQIRWFVRPDPQHGTVLERLGVRNHWMISGPATPSALAQLCTTVERVTEAPAAHQAGWSIVMLDPPAGQPATPAPAAPSEEPRMQLQPGAALTLDALYLLPAELSAEGNPTTQRQKVRRALEQQPTGDVHLRSRTTDIARALGQARVSPARSVEPREPFALRTSADSLQLIAHDPEAAAYEVACVAFTATEDEVMTFLERLDHVADVALPHDEIAPAHANQPVVVWGRALLRTRAPAARGAPPLAGLRVRLVYIPSSIPHQLGGVPEVGSQFLYDHLERAGARASVVRLPRDEYSPRLVELLGADVVGIGVYIHNRAEVAELVALLRQAGYRGLIVLGGPETRNIDSIQSTIPGWDAIIRGEAEETLPAVLETLDLFARGRWAEGLARAHALVGVALRWGDTVLLCNTALRNRASEIECPLPYDWGRGKRKRNVQMNFTRGCPYQCVFCPNHQGRLFRAGKVDQLWRYTTLAIADDLALPVAVEQQLAEAIQARLAIDSAPQLRLALHLLWRTQLNGQELAQVLAPLRAVVDPAAWSDAQTMDALVGMPDAVGERLAAWHGSAITRWQAKEAWLLAKLALLASLQRWRGTNAHQDIQEAIAQRAKPRFTLWTSEDNTLVNRPVIGSYLERRKQYGLTSYFVFNPGQNTIYDLTDRHGKADEEYIRLLVDENPFAVALGADGPSNAIIRQNRKPFYGVKELLAVNRALVRYGVNVANNYIMLTPETNLLEAIEAFALYILLPIPWRDYGKWVNMCVWKEDTTLSTDEGLIFAPHDQRFHVPFRAAGVQHLIDRWGLLSEIPDGALDRLLGRLLEEDADAVALLPLVIERWERDFDSDPELVALAKLVRQEAQPAEGIARALLRVAERLRITPLPAA